MVRATDSFENTVFNGNVTLVSSGNADLGLGDLEVQGSVFSDGISANTVGGAITCISPILFTNTTDASSSGSGGTVTVSGGLAVSKQIFTGGNITTSGIINTTNATNSTSVSTGAIIVSGGIGVSGNSYFAGIVNHTNTTNSTSVSTGAIVVSGGIGIGGNTSIGGIISLTSNTVPSSAAPATISIYSDTVDTKLKSKDNSGVVTVYQPITTKGDLVTSDGTILGVRLPVSTDSSLLTCSSSASTGLAWSNAVAFSDNILNLFNFKTATVSGSYTDLFVDQFRNITGFSQLNSSTNTDVIINTTSTVLVIADVSLIATAGTTGTTCNVRIVEDTSHTGSGSFSAVPGAFGYTYNLNTTTPGDTAYIIYAKNYTKNDRIKLQALQSIGTNTVTELSFGVNLSLINFSVNGQYDNSKYFNGYTNTTTVLGGTATDIPINVQRITDTIYTNTTGTASITISATGVYCIWYTANVVKTSGATNSLATFNLAKNGASISGSLGNIFIPNVTNPNGSISNCVVVSLTSGDIIKLQGILTAGASLSCDSGSNIILVYLSSSTNNQTSTKYAFLQQNATTTLAATPTDIPFGIETILTSGTFTHSTSSNSQNLIVNENGYYYIFGNATVTNSSASAGTAQLDLAYLLPNSTVVSYQGTLSQAHINVTGTTNINSIRNHLCVYIPAGYTIKLQGSRVSTTGTLSTSTANTTLIVIKASPNDTVFEPLIPFGSYYKASTYPSFTTSSLSFVPVCYLSTGTIPNGTYSFSYSMTNNSLVANKDVSIQIILDGTVFTTQVSSTGRATNILPIVGQEIIQLTIGNHIFELDASVGSSTAVLLNIVLSLTRIS